jgi:hypothetical protein
MAEEKKETCWDPLRKRKTGTKRIFESLSLAKIVGLPTTEFLDSSCSILLPTKCLALLKRSAKICKQNKCSYRATEQKCNTTTVVAKGSS